MALSLRSTATENSGTSTSPSVSLPTSGQVGDTLYVYISHNNGTITVSDNNGVTPMSENYDGGNDSGGMGVAIYSRVLDGSEPSTLNFTLSASTDWAVSSFIVASADGYDVSISSFNYYLNDTSPTCTECTTITNGAWAIAFLAIDTNGDRTINGGPGGSWVEINTINTARPHSIWYLEKATAGATGNVDFTVSASTNSLGMVQFAIKPTSAPVAGNTSWPRFMSRGFMNWSF